MWYVYLIKSLLDGSIYTGITNDLKRRFNEHNSGKSFSTKHLRPYVLIYYEAHTNKYDAANREQFLKSGWGKNWIKKNLRHALFEQSKNLGGN